MRSKALTTLAVTALAGLLLTACQTSLPEEPAPTRPKPEPEPAVLGNPTLSIDTQTIDIEFEDKHGETVTFITSVERPVLSEVEEPVAESFKEQVDDVLSSFFDELKPVVKNFAAEDLSCEDAADCKIPVTVTAPVSEVYEDYAGATLDIQFTLGHTSSSHDAYSVIVNTQTGKKPGLTEFVDLADEATQRKILRHLRSAENWQACTDLEASFAKEVAAWTPTKEGLALSWTAASNGLSYACGAISTVMPWVEEEPAETSMEDASGTWCHEIANCITIVYPHIETGGGALNLVPNGFGNTFEGCFDFEVPYPGPGGSGYASYCPAEAPAAYDPFLDEYHGTGVDRLMYGAGGEGFFYYRSDE